MIRKHKGINQQTGKLKKGYKYSSKKLKSGLPQIIRVLPRNKGKRSAPLQKGGDTAYNLNHSVRLSVERIQKN